jgi:hypothetical protein
MFQSSTANPARPRDLESRSGLSNGEIKAKFHRLLVDSVDVKAMNKLDDLTVRRELRAAIDELFLSHPDLLRYREKDRLAQELVDEMVGFGTATPLIVVGLVYLASTIPMTRLVALLDDAPGERRVVALIIYRLVCTVILKNFLPRFCSDPLYLVQHVKMAF